MADSRQPTEPRPSGSSPDAPALLASASILCGRPVDLVAIDMPLALTPINTRRVADDAVSRAYGGRKCGPRAKPSERGSFLWCKALLLGFFDDGLWEIMSRFQHLKHDFRDQLRGIEVKGWLADSNSTMQGGFQNTVAIALAFFQILLLRLSVLPSIYHPYTIHR
jgi:hypothetical protein